MNCPICGSKVHIFYYQDQENFVGDYAGSSADCSVCDYSELDEFYGHFVSFGDHHWEWTHDINQDELDKILAEINEKLSTSRPRFTYSKVRYYKVDND